MIRCESSLVLLLVLGNGLFVAAEYALVTARRNRLEEQARGGKPRRAARRCSLMDEPVRFIGAVQVGITVFAILVGAIGESLISRLLRHYMPHELAFLLSFAMLT